MSDPEYAGLAGKVALVAGGYGGIGEALARALARCGPTMVIGGRDGARANAIEAIPRTAAAWAGCRCW